MALFVRNPNDLLAKSIRTLQQNTNITRFSEGSKAKAIIQTINEQLGTAYSLFELNTAQSFVSGATGIYLDFIGELLGVSRAIPVKANADKAAKNQKIFTYSGSFGAINNGEDIEIPAGTIVKTSDLGLNNTIIEYRITEDVTLPAAQDEFYVSVESLTEGDSSNVGAGALSVLEFTAYADVDNDSLLTVNLASIETGKNFESDETYRFRIVNEALRREAANETAIRLAILSTPGVADYVIDEYSRGIGTADIYIQSIAGITSPILVGNVQSNIDDIKAEGTSIIARVPTEIGVQAYVTFNYKTGVTNDEKQEIELEALLGFKDYLINTPLGEGLVVNNLIKVIWTDNRVRSIGLPNKPLDLIYYYVPSELSTSKTRKRLLFDLSLRLNEKLVPEPSVSTPLVIRRS